MLNKRLRVFLLWYTLKLFFHGKYLWQLGEKHHHRNSQDFGSTRHNAWGEKEARLWYIEETLRDPGEMTNRALVFIVCFFLVQFFFFTSKNVIHRGAVSFLRYLYIPLKQHTWLTTELFWLKMQKCLSTVFQILYDIFNHDISGHSLSHSLHKGTN